MAASSLEFSPGIALLLEPDRANQPGSERRVRKRKVPQSGIGIDELPPQVDPDRFQAPCEMDGFWDTEHDQTVRKTGLLE